MYVMHAVGVYPVYTWRMTSRRSRRKLKNWTGKNAKSYPGAGWNKTRTKAREASQGGVSFRGGPGCLKCISVLFLVVRDETSLDKYE